MQSIAEMPFVAGHPALDFVNTAEQRGDPEAGDALHGPAELRLWGRRYGLLADGEAILPRAARAEFEHAREARELLYELFAARAAGRAPAAGRLQQLAGFAAEAYEAGELAVAADGGVRWRFSPADLATVRHVAVTSALDLLDAPPSARLKQCPGDHCGWFFLDATKRGNRRWCRMSECGQEAKNRQRRRGSGPGSFGA